MTSSPELQRVEVFTCDCSCHKREKFGTAAMWLYRFGPEASTALCTDCMLTRLTSADWFVRTDWVQLRKLIRSDEELRDLHGE